MNIEEYRAMEARSDTLTYDRMFGGGQYEEEVDRCYELCCDLEEGESDD